MVAWCQLQALNRKVCSVMTETEDSDPAQRGSEGLGIGDLVSVSLKSLPTNKKHSLSC